MTNPRGNLVENWVHDMRRHLTEQYHAGYRDGEAAALAKMQSLFEKSAPAVVAGLRSKAKTVRYTDMKKGGPLDGPVSKAPKKKRRNPWANLTPEQRQARVNAIRKGKGLPPTGALKKSKGPTVRDNSPPVIPIERATEPDDVVKDPPRGEIPDSGDDETS